MPNIYLPFIATAPPTATAASLNCRGFGIGVRSQRDAPDVALVLRLLHPVCWYNWWWYPRNQGEAAREYPPNYYPMIWNPGSNLYAWPAETVAALPNTWWFIGNEPINPQTRAVEIAPKLMADQARAFSYATGRGYGLCGEYLDEPGIAYCRELQRYGCVPDIWLWHVYPTSPDDWMETVYRAFAFDPNRPVIITETALWGQPPAAQRRLMDKIVWALDKYKQLHAVMWYDSHDAAFPQVSLLTAPGPDCRLTEVGRHYVDVTR